MQHAEFSKPTIKKHGRAYVRLYDYFKTPDRWLAFLERYTVEHFDVGMRRNGDCAVRVIDPVTQEVAALGLDIPSLITYRTHVATARSFWNEEFRSETHRRQRTFEVGFVQASNDTVVPR